MKRVIAIMLSIAMISSTMCWLAINSCAITIDGNPAATCASYEINGDTIKFLTDTSISHIEDFSTTIVLDLNGYSLTVSQTNSEAAIWISNGLIIKNGNLIVKGYDNKACISAGQVLTITDCKVNATSNGEYAISGFYGIYISNSTVIATSTGDNKSAITSGNGDIQIISNSDITASISGDRAKSISSDNKAVYIENSNVKAESSGNDTYGIYGKTGLEIKLDAIDYDIQSKATYSYGTGKSGKIIVDNQTITSTNVEGYFYNNSKNISFGVYDPLDFGVGFDVTYLVISGTDWIYVGMAPSSGNLENEESEEIRDIDVGIGNGTYTVPTSYKSVVLNDTKYVETEVMQSNNLFVPIDLTEAPKYIDGVFLNNDVYNYITSAGKGIEIDTRYGKAQAFPIDLTINNPVSFHLSDVSEVSGLCATAIMKKAMETDKIYAEVNYSYVTNGRQIDSPARIYVPVDGEAKVFFIINENTLGAIPCETRNGYCVFDRYFDGTYVVCEK